MSQSTLVFQLDAIAEKFDKVDLREGVPLSELLYHDLVLLFVDPSNKIIWIWEGRGASTRMKFLAAQLAPHIRDTYAIDYTITSIDDGDEPPEFKILCGLT
jgi:hypothetical protein